jgi:hypothetical protein
MISTIDLLSKVRYSSSCQQVAASNLPALENRMNPRPSRKLNDFSY